MEEFEPDNIIVLNRIGGELFGRAATYPPDVKPKAYKNEIRRRFCEALLANRVLLAEGRTEYDAIAITSLRLNELAPLEYDTLACLGIAIIDSESDSKIDKLGNRETPCRRACHRTGGPGVKGH